MLASVYTQLLICYRIFLNSNPWSFSGNSTPSITLSNCTSQFPYPRKSLQNISPIYSFSLFFLRGCFHRFWVYFLSFLFFFCIADEKFSHTVNDLIICLDYIANVQQFCFTPSMLNYQNLGELFLHSLNVWGKVQIFTESALTSKETFWEEQIFLKI